MNRSCPGCRCENVRPILSLHSGWRIMCQECLMMGPNGIDESDAWRRWEGLPRKAKEEQ